MAPKFKINCPICHKPELLYLSDHLKQVHQLSSDERQPWLKSAVFSSSKSNGIPYMPPFPFWGMRSIPQHSSDRIKPQPQQPRQPPRPTMKVESNCLKTKLYPDFQFNYSRLSLNGHLYKTDTSIKRTPRVGPCRSLLPLFDSL